MKLLNCCICGDVVALLRNKVRSCFCGQARGEYVDDLKVVYQGDAQILGMRNEDILRSKHSFDPNAAYPWFVIMCGNSVRRVEGGF